MRGINPKGFKRICKAEEVTSGEIAETFENMGCFYNVNDNENYHYCINNNEDVSESLYSLKEQVKLETINTFLAFEAVPKELIFYIWKNMNILDSYLCLAFTAKYELDDINYKSGSMETYLKNNNHFKHCAEQVLGGLSALLNISANVLKKHNAKKVMLQVSKTELSVFAIAITEFYKNKNLCNPEKEIVVA